jgi:hypothetical protein
VLAGVERSLHVSSKLAGGWPEQEGSEFRRVLGIWPHLVPAGFGILYSVALNQHTVAFCLYLVKIIQTLTN